MVQRAEIRSVQAKNFRALTECNLRFGRFTLLAGSDEDKKLAVLHLLDFSGQLMRGQIKKWLDKRELFDHELAADAQPSQPIIPLRIEVEIGRQRYIWAGEYDIRTYACWRETVTVIDSERQHVINLTADDMSECLFPRPIFWHQGSILSQVRLGPEADEQLQRVRPFVEVMRQVELLPPARRSEQLYTLLDVINSDRPVLILDGAEKGVHPELYSFLADKIRRSDKQAIIATNEPAFFDCLRAGLAGGFVYRFVREETC